MPVVNITFDRLAKFLPKTKTEQALDMLPFIGLDIEGMEDGMVRVEYNPNRPDFSSDYGIIRALRGLLGYETGMPKLRLAGKTGFSVKVEKPVKEVRPFVVALAATNGQLDDETIRQLIAMQEDLHNGIGRRRKKASIGIHNLDAVSFPVTYTALPDFSFTPLGQSDKMSAKQILAETETGKAYGHILQDKYPIIYDSAGNVLSFPPIINGMSTKVDVGCKNLFVEVTATDKKAAHDTLAVIAYMLHDAGFKIKTVTIEDGKKTETPALAATKMDVEAKYINELLGLDISAAKIVECLKKSRLDARPNKTRISCTIPRYRIDITNPVDMVEEVAVGYGIYNLEPTILPSTTAGQRSKMSDYFEAIRQTLTGLGMTESFNFSLTSRQVQYDMSNRPSDGEISVDGSKSAEHEVLRSSLVPSLLQSLSRNVHEEYPQKIFEIGKVFFKQTDRIDEKWFLAAIITHDQAGFTEIKSSMQALFGSAFGLPVSTKASADPLFIKGRCAEIIKDGQVGIVGEVSPAILQNFKLRMPAAAFEVDLTALLAIH